MSQSDHPTIEDCFPAEEVNALHAVYVAACIPFDQTQRDYTREEVIDELTAEFADRLPFLGYWTVLRVVLEKAINRIDTASDPRFRQEVLGVLTAKGLTPQTPHKS